MLQGIVTIDAGILGELEIAYAVKLYPGTPDRWYLPNGDPGYPGYPDEIEVLGASCNGVDLLPLLQDNAWFQELVMEDLE